MAKAKSRTLPAFTEMNGDRQMTGPVDRAQSTTPLSRRRGETGSKPSCRKADFSS
jgi:hypothetical protein